MTPAEAKGHLLQLQEIRKQLLEEAKALEWQARFRRSRASQVEDEIKRVESIINPPPGALVKYEDEK